MNKAKFIEELSKRTKLPKNQTEFVFDSALKLIQDSVAKGDEVKIVGFGTFDRIQKKARVARNPQNGEKVNIPSTKAPRFRAGKIFKERVCKKKK